MEETTSGLYSLRCLHLYILFLAVGLYICSLQLKEEASLMMVEQGTDLCFSRTVIIDFTLGHRAVQSHHTNNVGKQFHLVEWVLNKIRYFGWLLPQTLYQTGTYISYMQDTIGIPKHPRLLSRLELTFYKLTASPY